jgi:hypothetical protein
MSDQVITFRVDALISRIFYGVSNTERGLLKEALQSFTVPTSVTSISFCTVVFTFFRKISCIRQILISTRFCHRQAIRIHCRLEVSFPALVSASIPHTHAHAYVYTYVLHFCILELCTSRLNAPYMHVILTCFASSCTRLIHKVSFPGAVCRNKTQFHGNIYCNRYSKCSAIFQHIRHRN